MKKQISLSVKTPCAEEWLNFTKKQQGRYCNSCNKIVIDFTTMTDQEIVDFFAKKHEHTCGRFRPEQLKTFSMQPARALNSGFRWMQAGILTLLLALTSRQVSAHGSAPKVASHFVQTQDQQNKNETVIKSGHKIKGVVTDNSKETLPGVSIVLKNDTVGTVTDINGQFEFPKELEEGDVLTFYSIGLETIEYVVPKNATALVEIEMSMDYVELMGEVSIDEVYHSSQSGHRSFWQKFKELF